MEFLYETIRRVELTSHSWKSCGSVAPRGRMRHVYPYWSGGSFPTISPLQGWILPKIGRFYTRNSQRLFGVTTLLDSVIRSPQPLLIALDRRLFVWSLGQGFASLLHNLTLLRESVIFQPLLKWESPYPHPSISVAIWYTCRSDANMHKSQICTLPINSIMGSVEAEPLKTLVFQGFSLILDNITHSKLIQNVKR